jgi:transposase-like protein
MVDELEVGNVHRPRRYRTLSEKRRIAELTFAPGASVALVARANGVNANQVFQVASFAEAGRTERACDKTDISSSSDVVFSRGSGRR